MLLKKLLLSAVASAHLPNALPTQRLDDLRVTHKSQVTLCGHSHEDVFFSYAAVPSETFHFSKSFAVVLDEGGSEDLFDKEPDPHPPEIQNSTALPSAPGELIEAGIFNASRRVPAQDVLFALILWYVAKTLY